MTKVIIADDSMFMRKTLKEILTKAGYDIVGEASNGAIAVKLYQQLKPDIMTMDITMPEKNGLEALKEIKSIDKNMKIVMCSSMGQACYVEEAIKSGASDFILKPFSPQKVIEIFKKLAPL